MIITEMDRVELRSGKSYKRKSSLSPLSPKERRIWKDNPILRNLSDSGLFEKQGSDDDEDINIDENMKGSGQKRVLDQLDYYNSFPVFNKKWVVVE